MEIEMTVENGNVQISSEVIASIVGIAINETENFTLAHESFMTKVFQRNEKVIKVEVEENGELLITANVSAKYGIKIKDEARKLQESIIESVEIMTALNIKNVNIHIVSMLKDTMEVN